jgi:hypothetical protein
MSSFSSKMIELHLDHIESWKVSSVGDVLRNFLFVWLRTSHVYSIPLVDCLANMSFFAFEF